MTIDSVPITKTAVYDGANQEIRIASTQNSGTVELTIPASPRISKVVSCGIPLANSSVSSVDELVLNDENGFEVPAQFDVLTYWPNGSFKFILCTASVLPSSTQEKLYSLDYGFGVSQSAYSSNLGYTESSTEIVVSTGVSRITIDKVTGLIKSAYADTAGDQSYSKQVLGQAVIYTQDALDNVLYDSSNEVSATVSVIRNGPFQVMIRAEGYLRDVSNNTYTKYHLWYRFYKDSENFDFDYTMIDDQPSTAPSTNSTPFLRDGQDVPFSCRNIRIEIPHFLTSSPQYIFGGETTNSTGALSAETYIFQTGQVYLNQYSVFNQDPDEVSITSERTVKDGVVLSYSGVQTGELAKGFCTVHDAAGGASAIIRNFWKEWPNELNIDTSKITIHLHPERYVNGSPKNNFTIVDGFWSDPNTIWDCHHGISKTFEMTICIHASTPDATEIENITDDRNSHSFELRCSPTYYCGTGIWRDIEPENSDSTIYYNQLLAGNWLFHVQEYPHRSRMYGKKVFGNTQRTDFSANIPDVGRRSSFKMGTHYGAQVQFLYYLMMGEGGREWLDYSFDESKWYMDEGVNHAEVSTYSVGPLPPGLNKCAEHRIIISCSGRDNHAHSHVSALCEYYWFTGNPRAKEVLEEVTSHQAFISPIFIMPVPRPTANDPVLVRSGRTGPEGSRPPIKAERYIANFMYCGMWAANATSNFDFHNTTSANEMRNLLEWWKEKEDHYISGAIVSYSDYEAGTGYWLLEGSDNAGSSSLPSGGNYTNTCGPFMAAHLLQVCLDWYDQELLIGQSGIDLVEVKTMLYQCLQFINYWGWYEEFGGYYYQIAFSTTFGDRNAIRVMASPMARIYRMYVADLNAGNISNPEWYDHLVWKERILDYFELAKVYDRGTYSIGLYGYEQPWPYTFFKDAAAIEAEEV